MGLVIIIDKAVGQFTDYEATALSKYLTEHFEEGFTIRNPDGDQTFEVDVQVVDEDEL